MAPPPSRASGPYRPTRIGNWEVIAKIAGGGMSAVYLGRAVEPTDDVPSVVALKIMRHDVRTDDRLSEMFLAEGRLISRLVHPNIVRTHEVGSDAEQDFIAMELMLGKTFATIQDAVAARGVRLNAEIAAWAAARIADALHYAHELTSESGHPLALVHRDVNPANVFVTFQGEVKLFDFGLAKVTAGDAAGSPLLAGKLSYLSPEQIMQMPLDRRSDIFSLGTTLWELLTGKRLFRRDSDIETVRAVQLGPIPDPRAIAPEIPEELARIARTALERNREHRYPSAAHLARELDAFVFTRSSPSDITSRLAQLVDTLFPGEHKRQSGWLKPAIQSSISRPGNSIPVPSSVPSRPVPPDLRRDTRETTAVMAGAPLIARDGVPSVAPMTPRDGVPSVAPMTPRDGVPSVAPMTPRDGIRSVVPSSMPLGGRSAAPPRPSPSHRPSPSYRPPPSAPPVSLPAPTERMRETAKPARPTPSPFSRTEIQATSLPVAESRTDVQTIPPVPPTDRGGSPFDDKPSGRPSPSVAPPSFPPGAGLGISRPKRAPIPLPSRLRTDAPPPVDGSKKPTSAPRDSETTQVDVPGPPKRR